MSFPTTFAHKPVWPVAEVRALGYLVSACGIDLVLPERELGSTRRQADLAAIEATLLDAMGLQTFSSFFCVSFQWHGVYLRIDAWKPAVAQERQAA